MSDPTPEHWRPVLGFEGLYEVSNLGRVRGVDRWVNTRWPGKKMFIEGTVLSPGTDEYGYQRVSLRRAGTAYTRKVHRLVLEAFVGRCPRGAITCHDDGDPSNNRLSNLRWDTYTANMLDRTRHGRDHNSAKTHCPQGHPYAGRNLIVRNGRRICRECGNNASREYHRTNPPDLSRRTHGRPGTYAAGCRCDPCREAFRAWQETRKQGVLE